MKKSKSIIYLILICLFFLNCSKDGEQGPVGPQGAQGEQGIQGEIGISGADGQDGEQGPQGEPGTANVIYSEWFPSQFPDDIASTNFVFSVSAPDLTSEIVERGIVLAYGRYSTLADIGIIEQLPYSVFGSLNQHYSLSFSVPPASNSERVFIVLNSIDGTPLGPPLFEEYRYLIIPGGIPTSGKSMQIDFSKMTYQEICEHFNIPK